MDRVLEELQMINKRLETQSNQIEDMNVRLSSVEKQGEENRKVLNRRIIVIEKKMDIKESKIGLKIMGNSSVTFQEEAKARSTRDIDAVHNEVDDGESAPGWFSNTCIPWGAWFRISRIPLI